MIGDGGSPSVWYSEVVRYTRAHAHTHTRTNACARTGVFENQLLLSIFIAHEVIFEKSIKKGRKETDFPLQQEKAIKRQILTVPGSKFF